MSTSTSTQEHKKGKRKSVAGGVGGEVTVVLNEASSSAGPAFRTYKWVEHLKKG